MTKYFFSRIWAKHHQNARSMKNKLSPRDRLWVFADPTLKELIIRCELHLAKPITVEALRQLVQERLIRNFERFSWIISSHGHCFKEKVKPNGLFKRLKT
jgi:predicted nucleic acid-binding protein